MTAKAINLNTGVSRFGSAEQPKTMDNGKHDKFAYAKCETKSERNAIKKLLPYPLVKELLLSYLANEEEQALVTIHVTTKQKLIDYGISEEVFNEYCYSKYQKLSHELDIDTAKRMSAMLVKKDFREMLIKASKDDKEA
jgi:hypothetical protein